MGGRKRIESSKTALNCLYKVMHLSQERVTGGVTGLAALFNVWWTEKGTVLQF